MSLSNYRKIKVSSLFIIPVCILLLNTSTVMMGYYGLIKYFIVALFVFAGRYKHRGINLRNGTAVKYGWLVCVLFFWISVIFSVNRTETISYCITLTIFSLFVFCDFDDTFFDRLFTFFV